MRISLSVGGAAALMLAATPCAAFTSPPPATRAADVLSLPSPKAGRARPLIAIVADSAGAQTTDFIVPYAILKDARVADVRSLSTRAGPIAMTRGLTIVADETVGAFDRHDAAGADIIIVPAQTKPQSRALTTWLRAQASKGATIVSICEGARALAAAGLLDGKTATSHWASLDELVKSYGKTHWVRDRRYIQDGRIITTAGVTASIPTALALVAAIGGREAATATARRIGAGGWDAAHRTADFAIGKADIAAALLARAAVWSHETVEIPLTDGIDEMAVALEAEAWGRTYRSKVVTTRTGRAPTRTLHGLTILADAEAKHGNHVLLEPTRPALAQFDATLAEIGQRYGESAIRLVTVPMEYNAQETRK